MGTEIAQTETRLQKAGIVSWTKLLTSHELDRHRAALAIELEVQSIKVDRFGWNAMNEALRKRLRQDWVDALQDYGIEEVRAACRTALAGNVRDAVNEEKIRGLVIADRGHRLAAIPAAGLDAAPGATEDRIPASAEARARIMAEAGMTQDRLATISGQPQGDTP